MCVYYFRCYWPSNLVFAVRCVTSLTYIKYISIVSPTYPNLRKIGQKLRSLSWTIGISDSHTDIDRHTLKSFYICSMPCIAFDSNNNNNNNNNNNTSNSNCSRPSCFWLFVANAVVIQKSINAFITVYRLVFLSIITKCTAYTLWTEKHTKMCFCHNFHKTQSILIKFGVHCPE